MDNTAKTICNFDFSLTDQEWEEVRSLARQIFASEQFGRDHCKAYVAAFVMWSEAYEEAASQQEGSHNVH